MAVFSGFSAFWPGKNDFHEFSLFLSCFPVKNTSETVKTHRFYDFVLSGPTKIDCTVDFIISLDDFLSKYNRFITLVKISDLLCLVFKSNL